MNPTLQQFIREVDRFTAPEVLEIGTKRADETKSSHHQEWVPKAASFEMMDMQEGLDVTTVGDIEYAPFEDQEFDVEIACAVFEHIKHPWIAAQEMIRILRPGGLIFVQTHQTFPIHGYPSDYWRFTDDCLRMLFEEAGGIVIKTDYEFRCRIQQTEVKNWDFNVPSWLNVVALVTR